MADYVAFFSHRRNVAVPPAEFAEIARLYGDAPDAILLVAAVHGKP